MSIIPEINLLAYELTYKIEVGLREFLIDTFGKEDQKWWKQRLPPEVYTKLIKGIEKERKIKWIDLIPHHPLYYIDFSDLKKIIENEGNWIDALQKIFGDKNVYCGGLRELEPIRNRIAHNRKISDNDIFLLKSNNSKMESAIGKEKWEALILRQTVETDIYEKISQLETYTKTIVGTIQRYELINNLDSWQKIKNQWWFDSDYLVQDISPIETFYSIASKYILLPRYRGSGYIIEDWVKHNLSIEMNQSLDKTFASLLAKKGY